MEKTDLNAVYNVYIYKFNLPGGGDNKHSSAKYNKSESNLISSPKNLACSSIAASNCGSPTSSSLLAIIDR